MQLSIVDKNKFSNKRKVIIITTGRSKPDYLSNNDESRNLAPDYLIMEHQHRPQISKESGNQVLFYKVG